MTLITNQAQVFFNSKNCIHFIQKYISKQKKTTGHILIEDGHAAFTGHLAFVDKRGREFIISLPPFLLQSPARN